MNRAYSIEELAQHWGVATTDVIAELASGRLASFTVNGKTRVTAAAVERFEGADAVPPSVAAPLMPTTFMAADTFRHVWPNGIEETYDTAFVGRVGNGDEALDVRIGLAMRRTVGRERRRAVVFLANGRSSESNRPIAGRPLVEFVGADDYDRSHLLASLIKTPAGKEVRSRADLSAEYEGFEVVPYDRVVTGPYSHRGLAVLLRDDDLGGMVRHALIRGRSMGILR